MEQELRLKIKERVFDKQDKILLFNLIDKIEEAKEKHVTISTNVYNMSQIILIRQNILKYVNNVYIVGGTDDFERAILIISHKNISDDIDISKEIIANHLSLLKIKFDSYMKEKISHRDILGSILNLGINRNLLGDIFVNEKDSYIFVKPEIEKYIIDNLVKIKHTNIEIQKQDIYTNISKNSDEKSKTILLNSLRLDNILSHSLNISRKKTNEMINSERVSINWKIERKCDKKIEISDVISIQGKGRIKIENIIGNSKNGKIILEIKIFC